MAAYRNTTRVNYVLSMSLTRECTGVASQENINNIDYCHYDVSLLTLDTNYGSLVTENCR